MPRASALSAYPPCGGFTAGQPRPYHRHARFLVCGVHGGSTRGRCRGVWSRPVNVVCRSIALRVSPARIFCLGPCKGQPLLAQRREPLGNRFRKQERRQQRANHRAALSPPFTGAGRGRSMLVRYWLICSFGCSPLPYPFGALAAAIWRALIPSAIARGKRS